MEDQTTTANILNYLICTKCNQLFDDTISFKQHYVEHLVRNNDKSIECFIENCIFNTNNHLFFDTHIQRFHKQFIYEDIKDNFRVYFNKNNNEIELHRNCIDNQSNEYQKDTNKYYLNLYHKYADDYKIDERYVKLIMNDIVNIIKCNNSLVLNNLQQTQSLSLCQIVENMFKSANNFHQAHNHYENEFCKNGSLFNKSTKRSSSSSMPHRTTASISKTDKSNKEKESKNVSASNNDNLDLDVDLSILNMDLVGVNTNTTDVDNANSNHNDDNDDHIEHDDEPAGLDDDGYDPELTITKFGGNYVLKKPWPLHFRFPKEMIEKDSEFYHKLMSKKELKHRETMPLINILFKKIKEYVDYYATPRIYDDAARSIVEAFPHLKDDSLTGFNNYKTQLKNKFQDYRRKYRCDEIDARRQKFCPKSKQPRIRNNNKTIENTTNLEDTLSTSQPVVQPNQQQSNSKILITRVKRSYDSNVNKNTTTAVDENNQATGYPSSFKLVKLVTLDNQDK